MKYKIPFNKPSFVGKELDYIKQAVFSGKISGDGEFSRKCHRFIERKFHIKKTLLTTSCTHALEMAAILINLKKGDEVIAPSFTFSSTVNPILLRGAKPVFVDIRPDTKNIDENLIEEKINRKTKAIFIVHYAGIGCNMDKIKKIAKKYKLFIIEDAAHALNAKYENKFLGSIGDFGCFSFHETKNFIAGEGGALAINKKRFIERAEIIREKGTNRNKFFRGEVDKYTWVDIGSSYLPSELIAAFLYAQLKKMRFIQRKREYIYFNYLKGFKNLASRRKIELPIIPPKCQSNYHFFYILTRSLEEREALIKYLKRFGILAIFHYIPLHTSPMGKKLGYKNGDLPITEDISNRLLRIPLYNTLTLKEQNLIIKKINNFFRKR